MKRRCIQCRRRLGSRAQKLFDTPTGSVWLCGRRACLVAYNGGPPDDLADCSCGAHP